MQPHDVRFRDEEQSPLMVHPPDLSMSARIAWVSIGMLLYLSKLNNPDTGAAPWTAMGAVCTGPPGSAMSRFAIEPAIAKD